MAKINLNREEKTSNEVKENNVKAAFIELNEWPPRSIVFYNESDARYFFLNDEKVREAVKKLIDLIEEDGEEF